MALMERVATLLRVNISDLIDRTEDPEKLLKQLVVDMENQLLQVKTQVAIALTDQHLLEKKVSEHEAAVTSWHAKAELAVNKGDDPLARAALERAFNHERHVDAFRAQLADHTAEAEALRSTYTELQSKLAGTRTQCELLMAQHRRARMLAAAEEGRVTVNAPPAPPVDGTGGEAESLLHAARSLLSGDSLEDRFAQLEREQRVETLLAELKGKRNSLVRAR